MNGHYVRMDNAPEIVDSDKKPLVGVYLVVVIKLKNLPTAQIYLHVALKGAHVCYVRIGDGQDVTNLQVPETPDQDRDITLDTIYIWTVVP